MAEINLKVYQMSCNKCGCDTVRLGVARVDGPGGGRMLLAKCAHCDIEILWLGENAMKNFMDEQFSAIKAGKYRMEN